ncbi:MAG TPA: C2H2-type zinc finger protein [Nitrososphaera sp.]|nr:C2H2-type zinc finger protein [Nitrososphaera sp.]
MVNDPSSWTDLIGESVYTKDDQDIGDIEAVSRNFIVVKKGLVNVHRYYIPLHRVEGWDSKVVWLKIQEEEVKTNYERNTTPDPYYYHYSSAPTVEPANVLRRFQINMPKIPPRAQEESPFLVSQEHSAQEEPEFPCNLCGGTFKSEDELSRHVDTTH